MKRAAATTNQQGQGQELQLHPLAPLSVDKRREALESNGLTALRSEGNMVLSSLGKGSFGTVYKVMDSLNNITHAAKVVRYQKSYRCSRRDIPQEYSDEIKVSEFIKEHPCENIVEFHRVTKYEEFCIIFMECIDGSSLTDYMKKFKTIAFDKWVFIVKCLFNAVSHLRKYSILHRDIKPDNVIVIHNEDGTILNVKLVDFGLSRFIGHEPSSHSQESCYDDEDEEEEDFQVAAPPPEKKTAVCSLAYSDAGTELYKSPVVSKGDGYSFECDVFSVCATLAYVFLGGHLIPNNKKTYRMAKQDFLREPEKYLNARKEKVKRMVAKQMDLVTVELGLQTKTPSEMEKAKKIISMLASDRKNPIDDVLTEFFAKPQEKRPSNLAQPEDASNQVFLSLSAH